MLLLPDTLPQNLKVSFGAALRRESLESAMPGIAQAACALFEAREVLLFVDRETRGNAVAEKVRYIGTAEGERSAEESDAIEAKWIGSGVHSNVLNALRGKLAAVSYSAFSWPYAALEVQDVYGATTFSVPCEYALLLPISSRQTLVDENSPAFRGYAALLFDAFPSLGENTVQLIVTLPELLSGIVHAYVSREKDSGETDLSSFAHDMKRHLLINQEFLRVALTSDVDKTDKALHGIERAILRMLHETNSVLLSDKEQFGNLQASLIAADLNELVVESCDELRPLFESAHVKLRTELDEHLPPANVDPAIFPSVLHNLLDNALKYSDSGSEVIVRTQVAANDAAIVEVVDSGVPVHETDKPHIFKKRYRGNNVRAAHGNGLGLYLARKVVEAHHGALRLEEGLGATKSFVIELPPGSSLQGVSP